MDHTEWFLGLISYLLAALVLEMGLEGFILYQMSIISILCFLPIYLFSYPIYILYISE